jgi:hypothetical protein
MDVGVVVPNHLEIAPEQGVVPHIEADDCGEQSNIGFREMLAKDELTTESVR